MINEEKRQYLIDIHKLYMKMRPYDGNNSLAEKRKKEDELWDVFAKDYLWKIPKKLFRYRKANKDNFENFRDDIAWFSKPTTFGDTTDFTLNTDIESEIDEIEKNPLQAFERMAIVMIDKMVEPYGDKVDETMVMKCIPYFDNDGKISKDNIIKILKDIAPEQATDNNALSIENKLINVKQELVKRDIEGFLSYYLHINERIKEESYILCLSEEGNNQLMWENYADGGKGFCICYSFDEKTFLGQRMLMNLLPIYYGDREVISFFDALLRGLASQKQINGISYEDYEKWFVSSYTKDQSYSAQKEWRIAFNAELGGNKQSFPFAESIIIGEKMDEEYKTKLIQLAKEKQIKVYIRKLNLSGSRINIVQLF